MFWLLLNKRIIKQPVMAKEIKFNIKAREELKNGVDALADAVKVTLI